MREAQEPVTGGAACDHCPIRSPGQGGFGERGDGDSVTPFGSSVISGGGVRPSMPEVLL